MTDRATAGFTAVPLNADEGAAVLVADFRPFSSGPGLAELVAAGHGLAVHRIDPASDLTAAATHLDLDELAARYADSWHPPAATPVTVVGYCSAAVLAVRLAGRLAARGPVRTILARPTWPDAALIGAVLARIRSNLGADADGGPDLTAEADVVLTALTGQLRTALEALTAGHGVPATGGPLTELLASYRGWLSYLLAARDAVACPNGGEQPAEIFVATGEWTPPPWPAFATHRPVELPLSDDEAEATRQVAEVVRDRLLARAT